jgi:LmbE family N-acetylglucosaminyl deacetylase
VTEPPLRPFPDDWDRAVVVAAHPDDIEWGAAAAVAAWTAAGKSVSYLLVTRGEAGIEGMPPEEARPAREAEERASAAIVGVEEVTFLDHRDGHVEYGLDLRRDLSAALRRARPDLLVTINHAERWGAAPGAGWNSADHRAVGLAALDAAGDAGNRWIFPELAEGGLEPWSGIRRTAIAASHTPTHAVDVSANVEQAVASLAAHARYLEALRPEPPEEYARSVVGGMTSVAFEVMGGD